LGATWDGNGVNFAIYSEHATAVEICLFDSGSPDVETERYRLPERTQFIWHGYLPGAHPGTLYGYRVSGPYEPDRGNRFNPNKLLIDPYARVVVGEVNWDAPIHGFDPTHPGDDLSFDGQDSAWGVPKAMVFDPAFDWENDQYPRVPLNESVIYETHVKGFTQQHPDIPPEIRGTYAGLAHPASTDYLKSLGITAVELLPIHDMLNDERLTKIGLANYWGYNTTSFFAPAARYSASGDRGGQVNEFREMVKSLHREGIEVILDVVYNHTSEGNEIGPTLSFRGLDNSVYYLLDKDDPRWYVNLTGTGNTINARHPQVLQLIMDSLRYWVSEMHVDGFRFDLATTLGRDERGYHRWSAFLNAIHQDPVLAQTKLIAEPWDLGADGYHVGNYPVRWSEWNDRYRDNIRSFWKGDSGQVSELAARISGSSDLYEADGRAPTASINFITAHDGFTLHDLVSYEQKYNDANGEHNQDGNNSNIAWNSGVEGETNDPDIIELRERRKRTFLATLFWSQGVPMLLGGDEIGRSQGGNNNAYAQDNPVSWFDWELDERKRSLLNFTRRLIDLRRKHPNLRRRTFFKGQQINGSEVEDLLWLCPDGTQMTAEDFEDPDARVFGLRIDGAAFDELDEQGNLLSDDTMLILMNAEGRPAAFTLPDCNGHSGWEPLINTAYPDDRGDSDPVVVMRPGESIRVTSYSAVLMKLV
jgi:isoamylase